MIQYHLQAISIEVEAITVSLNNPLLCGRPTF